jgi:hypothetical protein
MEYRSSGASEDREAPASDTGWVALEERLRILCRRGVGEGNLCKSASLERLETGGGLAALRRISVAVTMDRSSLQAISAKASRRVERNRRAPDEQTGCGDGQRSEALGETLTWCSVPCRRRTATTEQSKNRVSEHGRWDCPDW